MKNEQSIRDFLMPIVLSFIGTGLSWMALVGFYDGKWGMLKLNFEYSLFGWIIRGLGLIASLTSIYLSYKGNIILRSVKTNWIAIYFSLIGVFWEIVSVAILIVLIVIVLSGMISGG